MRPLVLATPQLRCQAVNVDEECGLFARAAAATLPAHKEIQYAVAPYSKPSIPGRALCETCAISHVPIR